MRIEWPVPPRSAPIIGPVSLGIDTPLGARVSRAELVARELEREIVDDLGGGGEAWDQGGSPRQRFRVAVATINEAVRLLETRGLIEVRPGPGGGVFVSRPSTRVAFSHVVLGFTSDSTTYEQCLELRDALEPLVDRYAARYHKPADIRALNKVLGKMERSTGDLARVLHGQLGAVSPHRQASAAMLRCAASTWR